MDGRQKSLPSSWQESHHRLQCEHAENIWDFHAYFGQTHNSTVYTVGRDQLWKIPFVSNILINNQMLYKNTSATKEGKEHHAQIDQKQ